MPKIARLYNIYRWTIDLSSIIAIYDGHDECKVHFSHDASIVIYRTHRVSLSDPDAGWITYDPKQFDEATTQLIKAWEAYNESPNSQTES